MLRVLAGATAKVAIKRISGIFDNVNDGARVIRELKLHRLLNHPNLAKLLHVILPEHRTRFQHIDLVFEFMDTDLRKMRKLNDDDVDLTPDHFTVFMLQLLRGVAYMHANDVLHRDLKPDNILVNENCLVSSVRFGVAPGAKPSPHRT